MWKEFVAGEQIDEPRWYRALLSDRSGTVGTCSDLAPYEFAKTDTADEMVAGLYTEGNTGAFGEVPHVFDLVEWSPACDAFVVFCDDSCCYSDIRLTQIDR
jgi:hypothetical protein